MEWKEPIETLEGKGIGHEWNLKLSLFDKHNYSADIGREWWNNVFVRQKRGKKFLSLIKQKVASSSVFFV
jgi:hypothetical protein